MVNLEVLVEVDRYRYHLKRISEHMIKNKFWNIWYATILNIDLIYHLLLLEMDGDPETFGVCYVEETPLVCFHEQGILTSLL